jgi:hypothetical protein
MSALRAYLISKVLISFSCRDRPGYHKKMTSAWGPSYVCDMAALQNHYYYVQNGKADFILDRLHYHTSS